MCQGRLTPGIGVGHPSFNDGNPYYSGYINTLTIGAMTISYRREPMGVYMSLQVDIPEIKWLVPSCHIAQPHHVCVLCLCRVCI